MTQQPDVIVIGGGVVGVSAAYALASRGRRVVVIDQGAIGGGCSYGNAGVIVPSHCTPLAAPGVVGKALRWMLNPESPFYVRPRFDPELFRWLWQFRKNANESHARRSIPVLLSLLRASRSLFDRWTALPGMDCAYGQRGAVSVFSTPRGLEEGHAEARKLAEAGLQTTLLDQKALRELVPELRPGLAGGVYYPEDAHVDPNRFVLGLAKQAESKGAEFLERTEALGFQTAGRRIVAVQTTRGDLRADRIVLAAGAWSPGVAESLGFRLPIQPAKGYSLTFRRPERSPSVPLLLTEARMGVTPMGPLIRFAGTLEFAGMDFSINRRRVEAIQRAATHYLEGMENLELVEIWRGMRPCTPDGLPFLGPSSSWENLILAAGHAMIGVSMGPISGEITARIACGEEPGFDLGPFRQQRFN